MTTFLLVDRKLRVRVASGTSPDGGDEDLLGADLVDAIAAPTERRKLERAARLALGGQTSSVHVETGLLGSRNVRFSPAAGRVGSGRGALVAVEARQGAGRLQELEARARDLEALSAASSRLARADDAHQIAKIACDIASEVASSDFAALLKPDESGSSLVVAAVSGAELGGSISLGQRALATTAFKQGQQLYSDRLKHLGPAVSWPLQDAGARAGIWQPIRRAGGVAAVLIIGWRRRMTAPGHRILAAVELLADEAAVTLERAAAFERLTLLARTDPLTNLYNRRAWEDELARELARASRFNERLSIGLIDIDFLKGLNDLRGHQAGDRLLQTATARWRRRLRVIDALARIGGDEFAMTLPNCSLAEAVALGTELRGAMPEGSSCSVGIAEWVPGESVESLLARADRALYEAKHSGRDRTAAAHHPATGQLPLRTKAL